MERGNKKELVHNEKEEKKNECIIEERNAREQKKKNDYSYRNKNKIYKERKKKIIDASSK